MAIWLAIGSIGAAGSALVAIGSIVGLRLRRYRPADDEEMESREEFEPGRYAPMARLLGTEDLDFLHEQAECAPALAARWERSRLRIFRMYLRDLAADFQSLHARARLLVAESPEEYSALVPVLMRQQLVFWRALAGIELRLLLKGFGLKPVDVRGLTGAIDALRLEIARSKGLYSPSV